MPIKSTTKEELDKLNTQLGNIADVLDSFSKCKKNGINIAKEQINHYTKRAERIKREILALKSKEDLKEQTKDSFLFDPEDLINSILKIVETTFPKATLDKIKSKVSTIDIKTFLPKEEFTEEEMEFTPPDQIRNFCFNITSEMETIQKSIFKLKILNDDKECLNNLYSILENRLKETSLLDIEIKIAKETIESILRRQGFKEEEMLDRKAIELSRSYNPSIILACIKEILRIDEMAIRVHKDKINTSLASFISYKNKLNLKLSEIHKAINKGLGDINESK